MREIHLVKVKYCEDAWQHEVLCKRLKAKEVTYTPFFVVWVALFIPHTL